MSRYTPFRIVLGKLNLASRATDAFWLNDLLEDSWFLLVSNLVEIATAVLTIAMVLWITAMQDRKRTLEMDAENQAVN